MKIRYLPRLGPPPPPLNPSVSKSMRGNKAKYTLPEILLSNSLKEYGMTGYRHHCKRLPGTPDICFPEQKLVIFVQGCFWHRCPYCTSGLPKTHSRFWKTKFLRNKIRDKIKRKELKELGWRILSVWECQIKKDTNKVVSRIAKFIEV